MSKTACNDERLIMDVDPRFKCKKCGATVKKEKQACKPKKIKK
jgi:Zn finger protein HypA/HybF involved in hydrogenase expression